MDIPAQGRVRPAAPIPIRAEKIDPTAREDADASFWHGGARITAVAFDEALKDVVAFAALAVNCDSCLLYLLEGDELVLRASKNTHPEVVNHRKMKLGQGITGWVAAHREPVVVAHDAYRDPRVKLFNELQEDRFEALLSVPIVAGSRLVGVINLQSRVEHSYNKREVALIATLGFLVGAEIERARLQAENSKLQSKLEARAFIERAKGILQRDLGLSEDDAYRLIQRESQQRRKSMREIAEAVILSDNLKSPRNLGDPPYLAGRTAFESPR